MIEENGCPSFLVEWDRAFTITETFQADDDGAATRNQQHEVLDAKRTAVRSHVAAIDGD